MEPTFGIIELFGHAKIAGKISEESIGGTNMIRVDVPGTELTPAFTKFYGAGAIYSITPTSEEIMLLALKRISPEPVNIYMPEIKRIEDKKEDDVYLTDWNHERNTI